MNPKRAPLLILALTLLAASAAHAAPARAACALHPAADVPSQSPDALSATLDAAHPVVLANWDVRWQQRHRLWITLSVDNRADTPAHVLPQMLLDARADGGAASVLAGPPLTIAPHAQATDRLSVYVPDDAKTLGVRLLGATLAGSVAASFSLECSDARFDIGERSLAVAPLMDEALRTYFNSFIDPLNDPHASYDTARMLGSGAQEAGDVAWTLRGLMQAVHDTHGFAAIPGEAPPARRAPVTRAPEFELRPDGVAIVRLHGLDASGDADALAWATSLHDKVSELAARHPRAWIVDLRDHDTQAPWPAFAALSSLLGGPVVGATVSRHQTQDWIADRGVSRVAGGPALMDVQASPEPPFTGPVAVLLGPGTRNAGEDLAVAFRGRPHTRFFGSATAGFPTEGVVVHPLSDGSLLGVLETRAADRKGVIQRVPLEPDDALKDDSVPVMQAVQDWLSTERDRSN
jgi:hypothetical protein